MTRMVHGACKIAVFSQKQQKRLRGVQIALSCGYSCCDARIRTKTCDMITFLFVTDRTPLQDASSTARKYFDDERSLLLPLYTYQPTALLTNKNHNKPRPIQIMEVVWSYFAKRYAKQYAKQIWRATSEEHPWGISMPGACESLCHWRGNTEDMATSGDIQPVIIADFVQVNIV